MLEKYRVLAQLGRGGMAEVYLAAAEGPSGYAKLLVIKVLDRTLERKVEFVRMFADEAKLSARLNHPNVVQTFEVGESGGHHFIAMEYLEGQPLNKVMERFSDGLLSPGLALKVISEALSGLHYAHELRDFEGQPLEVVHRDITPQNLFITYEGQVKVLDFGIAKAHDSRSDTTIGTVKGKVTYMAPEQARGETLDRRADVFSIAVVLWELLAGRRLWEGLTDVAVIGRLVQGEIPDLALAAPHVPASLAKTVMSALSPRREQRPISAAALQAQLEVHLEALTGKISTRRLGELMRDVFQEERAQVKAVVKKQLEKAARTTPSGETPPSGIVIPRSSAAGDLPILGEGAGVHEAPTALHTGLTGQAAVASSPFGGTPVLGTGSTRFTETSNTVITNAHEFERMRSRDRMWMLGVGGLVVASTIGAAAWVVSSGRLNQSRSGEAFPERRVAGASTEVMPTADCNSPKKPLIELSGEIGSDAVLTCDKEYLLRFTTTVLPGATLSIMPGTVIRGDLETKGKLVVQPGAKIEAVGTRENPIVFTSAAPEGKQRPGDWGGLIILGQAPTNLRDKMGKPTSGRVEGLTAGGEYGGTSPNDSSGRVKYVRIEYSGTELAPNNEINGLTLGGVGRGTLLEYIQVRYPADDCFEFFGGTVDGKHLICSHVDDDGFDWDFGYQGRLQFIVSTASSVNNDGSNGIEGDNDPNGSTNEPLSSPMVYNASLFGKGRVLDGKEHYGILLRRGTQGRLRNMLVTGFSAGVDLRDTTTRLNIAGSIFFDNLVENLAIKELTTAKKSEKLTFDDDGNFDEAGYLKTEGLRIGTSDPHLASKVSLPPKPIQPLLEFGAKPPDDGFFDVGAEYVGAFRDQNDAWDSGAWVVYD